MVSKVGGETLNFECQRFRWQLFRITVLPARGVPDFGELSRAVLRHSRSEKQSRKRNELE